MIIARDTSFATHHSRAHTRVLSVCARSGVLSILQVSSTRYLARFPSRSIQSSCHTDQPTGSVKVIPVIGCNLLELSALRPRSLDQGAQVGIEQLAPNGHVGLVKGILQHEVAVQHVNLL
jgi:hypothetical protein